MTTTVCSEARGSMPPTRKPARVDALDAPDARYARQVALAEVGLSGQARIHESTIAIVGIGALGSMQAELLARAGVGTLRLIDRDLVELHNVQRQALIDEADVTARRPKALAAARHLARINSSVAIEAEVTDVTARNVGALIADATLVLDGTDNHETRYLLNDACVRTGTPWVYGGVVGGDGMAMAIRPGVGPCLRCLAPEPPSAGVMPTCETRGVLNTAVAAIAALEVTLGLKLLVGAPMRDGLHLLDIWNGTAELVPVRPAVDCPCCVARRFDFLEGPRQGETTVLCGRDAIQVTPAGPTRIDFETLGSRLAPLGEVCVNELVLELRTATHRLAVFRDGRALVFGTADPVEARALVARFIGI